MHPLVNQLRFARGEFARCFAGVSDEDAGRRLGSMNCLSWIVGHLAAQEHGYWVVMAQGQNVAPGLYALTGYGQPASTPPLAEMWAAWHNVTAAADVFLDSLTDAQLPTHFEWKGKPAFDCVGRLLLRNIYHYFYHTGEAHAIRDLMGHSDLPEYIGDMGQVAF